MSAMFTADEILYAATGRVEHGRIGSEAGRLAWNLEDIGEGDWFLAMPRGSEDTHDHLFSAFKLGARGCIVNKRNRYSFTDRAGTLISVSDTRLAIHEMARYWRCSVNPRVIAVVGTDGRKAIIELLEFLLKDTYRCHKALEHGGFGCLADVLEMPRDTEILIAEVSGVERGDVARIGSYLEPDVAIIGKVQHPLPSRDRDMRIASLYCEILETIRDCNERCAVVYDRNDSVKERAKKMLDGLRPILFSKTPGIPDGADRFCLADHFCLDNGQAVAEVEVWCALQGAKALGLAPKGKSSALPGRA